MARIFRQHKKLCIVLIGVVCLTLVAGYLYALLQPGIWHGDVFLHEKEQEIFVGSDRYADYRMEKVSEDGRTNILFAVNDTSKLYRLVHESDSSELQLFEDGSMAFEGQVHPMGDCYMLEDSNGEMLFDVTVRTEYGVPDLQELYPSYAQLYKWAVEGPDIRGNFAMVAVACLIAVMLGLDIAFPDLFFTLSYRLAVEGGEPSGWYRTCQKFSRVVMGIGIVVCIVLSLTTH